MLPSVAARSVSSSSSSKTRDLQPVLTFGKAAASCSTQAKAYGSCILASYESVERGMCEEEFRGFKACVQKRVSMGGERSDISRVEEAD